MFDAGPGAVEAGAVLSPDGRYRYVLSRAWDLGPVVTWVLLNPSTADAHTDDATVRRVIGYSRGWGMGRAAVVNLFALRSTDPRGLLVAEDPVGPDNEAALRDWIGAAHLVVVGWGPNANRPQLRRHAMTHVVCSIASAASKPLTCLAQCHDGSPSHPLRLHGSLHPQPWEGAPCPR